MPERFLSDQLPTFTYQIVDRSDGQLTLRYCLDNVDNRDRGVVGFFAQNRKVEAKGTIWTSSQMERNHNFIDVAGFDQNADYELRVVVTMRKQQVASEVQSLTDQLAEEVRLKTYSRFADRLIVRLFGDINFDYVVMR